MSAPINIAIAGITSKLALRIASKLIENPNVHLRGSCRNISKAPTYLKDHDRVQLIQTDAYDTENLRTFVRGCDTVICCYFADNETMTSGQKLLIDICEEEEVRRYFASDYTGDYRTLDYGDIPEKDPMKDILAYLSTKKRIVGIHVLVGLLMETFWNCMSGWDAKTNTFHFWGSGEERWELTSYQTVTDYVAAVALDGNAIGFLKFLGDRISIREVADAMERVYGTRPTLESLGSLEDRNGLRENSNDENPMLKFRKNISYLLLSGKATLGKDLDNAKYAQVEPESLVEFLRARELNQIWEDQYGIAGISKE